MRVFSLMVLGIFLGSTVFATVAKVDVQPLGKAKVKGELVLQQDGRWLHISGSISGLVPGQAHGFHLHEFGDCSAPDGMSAGGHYNPDGHKHGALDSQKRHFGDFGNIEADADGVSHVDLRIPLAQRQGLDMTYGRAVVVHAHLDDLATDPAGNAGPRIGCGIVGHSRGL